MSNAIDKWRKSELALESERRLMNEALIQLGKTERKVVATRPSAKLIFGLDLTGSRELGLKQARIATAAMFDAIKAIGRIAVKLVYYRGSCECRESRWLDDPDILTRSMMKLACEAGGTQIARILQKALDETEKLSGVVFIGDCCEEDPDGLVVLAKQLGKRSIPVFVFHECDDYSPLTISAKPCFKALAEASGGVYVEFHPNSGAVLKELLSSVAAFSTGGMTSVERLPQPVTAECRQLRGSLRLMLGSGGNPKH